MILDQTRIVDKM